ncbi:MAG: glycogen debranching enzyme, partial [Sphingobium sp.]|nr:glycogen debranching enzyme [Sphingobium sp.]
KQNRDGHGDNFTWNNGVEGASDDPPIRAARQRDVMALLATLFCSRGTIMLSAGDEFGRSQQGNNNAYAQDNAISWIDWANRDTVLEAHAFALAALRAGEPDLHGIAALTDADVEWLDEAGNPLTVAQWEDPDRRRIVLRYRQSGLAICVNGSAEPCRFHLPHGAAEAAARSILVSRPER